MYRASIILKNAREDHCLEIGEVSKRLKISAKYIEAIETENRPKFPEEPYCSLIIKDYANFLGLNGEDVLSLFRRDFAASSKSKPAGSKWQFFNPQFTFKVAIIASIFLFLSYLVMEYVKYNRPPPLTVNWPSSTNLTQSSFDLTGITDPESTVRINDNLIIVDPNGGFEKKITLTSSDSSTVVVQSESPNGQIAVQQKTFHLSENPQN
jgi:cytoskeletal protein RodZ